ncbi:NAD(P)-binding protein [Metschnikowia bicuspidata var. bicuspidata NRRL YB-4993]|uniref:NAD(P)-binding protein n=1 Tax=Metschnikowia bicuspidata var. bicuspidata NRRL YB-4993 TaxID=869754 RepID=A0A1A0HHH4_9ASCO|nr:NAD(P)-binding protein [Metschnikowia bicuspidata var. bicuspidata NRRL YB-4993]OBA23614.1 NAD(P)-binding protein [Metschnikowia bicuspidata var. bicuspidata NRRL YB-4993]
MSKVIVFGSHGKVGQNLIKLLALSDKYQATAVIRSPTQASTLRNLDEATANLNTSQLDMGSSSVDDLTKAIRGHNAVILTVGSAGKDLLKVDLDGVVKTFEASVQANVRRLILVSAVYAHDRVFGAATPLRDYYISKHYADRILKNEFRDALDFTILKPSRLTDGEGTGRIRILTGEQDVGLVDRKDVARAIFEILDEKSTFGKEYDFTSGDLDISDRRTWA